MHYTFKAGEANTLAESLYSEMIVPRCPTTEPLALPDADSKLLTKDGMMNYHCDGSGSAEAKESYIAPSLYLGSETDRTYRRWLNKSARSMTVTKTTR